MKKLLILTFLTLFSFTPSAWAADGATMIFESGLIVQINDGYTKLVEAMRGFNKKDSDHNVVELTLSGNTFLVNVSELVILCRDKCSSMEVAHQLDPLRGKE